MRAIVLAVLMALFTVSTAVAQEETPFDEALTEYTLSMALIDAASAEAEFMQFEDIASGELELEIGTALDKMDTFVVKSCYQDWYRVAYVRLLNIAAFWRDFGTNIDRAQDYINAMAGLTALMNYYQTDAVVACGLGET